MIMKGLMTGECRRKADLEVPGWGKLFFADDIKHHNFRHESHVSVVSNARGNHEEEILHGRVTGIGAQRAWASRNG